MRLIFETKRNFSTFLAARLIFVTVLLGLAVIFRPTGQSAAPYIVLLTANVLLSLGCWEWFRRRQLSAALRWVVLTGAVFLDTLALRYTGGAESEFVFLYFFSIGSAGLLTGLAGSLWTAILASAGLVWLFAQESPGYLQQHGFPALFYAVNFVLTALLTSYVYARFRERERSHVRTLGELEQMRLDTQTILDSLNTGVLVLDSGRRVLYSNPAGRQILGFPGDASAADVHELLGTGSPLGEAVGEFLEEQTGETRREIEFSVDGKPRPIGFTSSPLLDVAGERRGSIILFSDLTRVKEAERADRERDRLAAIGMLSRDLAHAIRNPLATVRGSVEMIEQSDLNLGNAGAYLNLALRESDRLNNLLRDFLTFAHVQAPNRTPGDLAATIRHSLAESSMSEAVRDELPEHLDAIFDSDQIGLAIHAILLSLAEWSEGKGEIQIGCNPVKPSSVRFLLTKKELAADICEAVFRPFSGVQRLPNAFALPTALRAVHAHGGELTLHTEPGTGTWFELAL
ncbi:MAG: histidine kinase dimerization/phospho-acceptor domain-containing protein [bacterium]|nr:histidine kinase dimerization/phospho-acceptor domain-containing protein [bacterium]